MGTGNRRLKYGEIRSPLDFVRWFLEGFLLSKKGTFVGAAFVWPCYFVEAGSLGITYPVRPSKNEQHVYVHLGLSKHYDWYFTFTKHTLLLQR